MKAVMRVDLPFFAFALIADTSPMGMHPTPPTRKRYRGSPYSCLIDMAYLSPPSYSAR